MGARRWMGRRGRRGRWGRWGHVGALAVAGAAVATPGRPGLWEAAATVGAVDARGTTAECRAAPPSDPAALLERARVATGADGTGERVLHYRFMRGWEMSYQSDRSYPPYFSAMESVEAWYDPATGAERSASSQVWPGRGPTTGPTTLVARDGTFSVRDTGTVANPLGHETALHLRDLNPWAVLADWRAAPGVRDVGECRVRDYWRRTLERDAPRGVERLHLAVGSGFPVALERKEPHYLWGDVEARVVWSNWKDLEGGAVFPMSAFRLVDGAVELTRTVGDAALEARGGAPDLVPPAHEPMAPRHWTDLGSTPPDTVRIDDATFLLVNPFYTHAVALRRDTVFLLDATLSEARARADSAWIDRLFPGDHPRVLVVTDLAWPHLGGLRFWVARGATVASHRASEAFLRRVVERRWTLAPDALEKERERVSFRFRPVDGGLALADGEVALVPLDGAGSEGAVVAWLPGSRFLWAGDFVQTLDEPSRYAAEVAAAARREGIRPQRAAAQHAPLFDWARLEALLRKGRAGG